VALLDDCNGHNWQKAVDAVVFLQRCQDCKFLNSLTASFTIMVSVQDVTSNSSKQIDQP
jgi:hypothetical protein